MRKRLKKWENIEKKYKEILAGEIRRTEYILSHKEKEIKNLKEEIDGLKEIGKIKDALIQVMAGGICGKNVCDKDIAEALLSPRPLEIKRIEDGYRIKAGRQKDK